MADPIAIVGMHRTGTSMVTRVLHDAGLQLVGSEADELIEPAADNPEGFWENKAIVAVNDDLLEAAGGSWDNPPDLVPQAVDDPRVRQLVPTATEALAKLRTHDHWGFKDPRTCLTARFWLDLQPDLRFIVCVRNPLEVAQSLKRRNQNSYSLGLDLWERYYREVLDAVAPDRRLITHYDTFFVDPVGETARLCEFAGLDAIRPRVQSDLRHHEIDVSLTEAGVSPGLRALYAELCADAGLAVAPELPYDEGRVRRLVLDGIEAKRHADQRLAHIKTLESRRADDAARIRELEQSWSVTFENLVRRAAGRAASLGRGSGRSAIGRPSRAMLAEARATAVPRAKAVAGRLPEPAQQLLRRGLDKAQAARAAPKPTVEALRQRIVAGATRGAPLDEWRDGFASLVARHVGTGRRWLLVRPGSPPAVRRIGPPSSPFPNPRRGAWPDDEQGLVAHLEALRFEGHEVLVVPEGSRSWFDANPQLRDHVAGRYRRLADEPRAGIAFDLTEAPEEGARTLLAAVSSLTREAPGGVAVLDWTADGVAEELPGTTTFRPRPGAALPYLDASIDVVIVDAAADHHEARRVAAFGVVTVERSGSGIEVTGIHRAAADTNGASRAAPRVAVLAAGGDDPRWRAALEEVVADLGARRFTLHWGTLSDAGGADVVIALEPGVLPLPGALDAAASLAAADPTVAVAAKVLGPDGRLHAAGGIVFADRSSALIGHGSLAVRAPWHEFVRPVCWPAGLVAASAPLWREVAAAGAGAAIDPADVHGSLREWGAAAWEASRSVRYQPGVVAVLVTGDDDEPATPVPGSRWQRVLDLRPPRPAALDDTAWRDLVAGDDVNACRG